MENGCQITSKPQVNTPSSQTAKKSENTWLLLSGLTMSSKIRLRCIESTRSTIASHLGTTYDHWTSQSKPRLPTGSKQVKATNSSTVKCRSSREMQKSRKSQLETVKICRINLETQKWPSRLRLRGLTLSKVSLSWSTLNRHLLPLKIQRQVNARPSCSHKKNKLTFC